PLGFEARVFGVTAVAGFRKPAAGAQHRIALLETWVTRFDHVARDVDAAVQWKPAQDLAIARAGQRILVVDQRERRLDDDFAGRQRVNLHRFDPGAIAAIIVADSEGAERLHEVPVGHPGLLPLVIPVKAGIRICPSSKFGNGAMHIHVLSMAVIHQFALWIARLSTDSAASCTTSDRVGCAWMMRARSSEEPLNSIATTPSAISSETSGPHMCTPRMRSVSACAMIFTRPTLSLMASARPLAANGNEPVLYGMPSSLHCCSVLPAQAISGSV